MILNLCLHFGRYLDKNYKGSKGSLWPQPVAAIILLGLRFEVICITSQR